jgi:hypothetical protein
VSDFYLNAPTEAAMLSALHIVGLSDGTNFFFSGVVPGGGEFTLRILGLLSEPIPGSEFEQVSPGVQVAQYGTPSFWVKLGWYSPELVPNFAALGLTVYDADQEAVTPPYDPNPSP